MRARDRVAGGFTLIEVVVALAILSVAVVTSIQAFAQGLRLLKTSGDHQRATLYADAKLREVLAPQEGHEEQTDPETGITWERDTAIVEFPEAVTEGTPEPLWRVLRITVRVRWGERRQLEVATLRTVSTAQLEGTPGATSRTREDADTPGSGPSARESGTSPDRGTPSARSPATPSRTAPAPGPSTTSPGRSRTGPGRTSRP